MRNDLKEQRVVFGTSRDKKGNTIIIIGIPKLAWEYMQDGKTNNIDLSKLGAPLQIVLYGASDHETALKYINGQIEADGHKPQDKRTTDFSIPDEKDN